MSETMCGSRSVMPIFPSLLKTWSLRFPTQTTLSLKHETSQIIGSQGCHFT